MGIFNFFPWLKNTYPSCVETIPKDSLFRYPVDNFMIDGNCIYHPCTQKVYGSTGGTLLRSHPPPDLDQLEQKCFEYICDTIDSLIKFVRPRKRFVMSSDGTAPLAKQVQQRCRRLKSSKEVSTEQRNVFDSNCMTPGTVFMERLSKYIKNYFENKCNTPQDSVYRNLTIVFTDDTVPGEGEAKLLEYIRLHRRNKRKQSWCIYSADADLIMLALASQEERFYLLRDNIYQSVGPEYFSVNIKELRSDLVATVVDIENISDLTSTQEYTVMNDFIVMCFLAGNDFLPSIPTIDIRDGAISLMLKLYRKNNCTLTHYDGNNNVLIDWDGLYTFIGVLAAHEQSMINRRVNSVNYHRCYPLPPLVANTVEDNTKTNLVVDLEGFREGYYLSKFGIEVADTTSIQSVVHSFLEGMQWVITYYCNGLSDWGWKYPHHYAPFLKDIRDYIHCYTQPLPSPSEPNEPFVQLLSVLPPASKMLLPSPLRYIYEKYPYMYPDDIKVDLEGKRYEYEGVILTPFIDTKHLKMEVRKSINRCTEQEKKRNLISGNITMYRNTPTHQCS